MKLVKKNILQADIAGQRKQQIDEGVKIAQRVDVLRETLATLEVQYESQVTLIKKKLQEAYKSQEGKSSPASVRNTIETEEQRKAELAPYIKELDSLILDNRFRKDKYDTELADLELKTKVVDYKNEQVDGLLAKIKNAETEAVSTLRAIKSDEAKTKTKLAEAISEREKVDEYFIERNEDLEARLAEYETKRVANELKERELGDKEQRLKDKERAVNDKYETLLRSEKAIKKYG